MCNVLTIVKVVLWCLGLDCSAVFLLMFSSSFFVVVYLQSHSLLATIEFQIACISPSSYVIQDTMNTLRYASRAKCIKNKPVVKVVRLITSSDSIYIR